MNLHARSFNAPALVAPVRGPELSVVVPTLNEAGNIGLLYEALCRSLSGVEWEMIVVDDDSRDETVAITRALATRDRRVRCIRRIGRRGLSGAVTEGILSSSATAVAVIDADMQHDERLLSAMLTELNSGAELVIGSRHVAGGDAAGGFTRLRRFASDVATRAARVVLRIQVSDPMSGFFMLKRDLAEQIVPRLSTQGFKVLLDLIVSSPQPLKIVELPYTFRPRRHGLSKLDGSVVWDFAGLLIAKASGDWISTRFLAFGLVGLSGLAVHLMALRVFISGAGLSFDTAQFLAAYTAMLWNFSANNVFTYRDRRLTGGKWIRGLLSFCAVCSFGAIANVGVASWVYDNDPNWWIAGAAGAIMGAVFNYAVTASVTWRRA